MLYIYIYEYNHNKGQKNFKREDKKLKAKNGELQTNVQNVSKRIAWNSLLDKKFCVFLGFYIIFRYVNVYMS